jgi:hypothetical protein
VIKGNRGSLPHVVGVGFEGQSEHPIVLSRIWPPSALATLRAMARLRFSLTKSTASTVRNGTS